MVKVVVVKPPKDSQLEVQLSNGKHGIFDVAPYLSKGIFAELTDRDYFNRVRVEFGGVAWPSEQDFSAETIECELKEIVSA